jgi:hypothetical protein
VLGIKASFLPKPQSPNNYSFFYEALSPKWELTQTEEKAILIWRDGKRDSCAYFCARKMNLFPHLFRRKAAVTKSVQEDKNAYI